MIATYHSTATSIEGRITAAAAYLSDPRRAHTPQQAMKRYELTWDEIMEALDRSCLDVQATGYGYGYGEDGEEWH